MSVKVRQEETEKATDLMPLAAARLLPCCSSLAIICDDLITKTVEFVYAWSLSSVLDSLVFGIFFSSTSTDASYQANLGYAAGLTMIAVIGVPSLQSERTLRTRQTVLRRLSTSEDLDSIQSKAKV